MMVFGSTSVNHHRSGSNHGPLADGNAWSDKRASRHPCGATDTNR